MVARGHSWSLVVIRGHSWSLVSTFRPYRFQSVGGTSQVIQKIPLPDLLIGSLQFRR